MLLMLLILLSVVGLAIKNKNGSKNEHTFKLD
jgi:hypothetical protein